VLRLAVLCCCLAALTLAATAAAATVPGMRSPAGTMSCVYAAKTYARNNGALFCTIAGATYGPKLERRCLASGKDWEGFELPANAKGLLLCAAGAVWHGSLRTRTVKTGATWKAGPYACKVAAASLTCRSQTGHGLFLSSSSWRVW